MTDHSDLLDDGDNTRTIADHIYHALHRDIVSGVLMPGTKLRMEEFSRLYGVGMSPLREALIKLTGDALVCTEKQRGFWVSPISIDELDDTTEIHMLIETEAVARSIRLGEEAWEARVRKAHFALREATQTLLHESDEAAFKAWMQASRRFHDTLGSACASPWLIRMRRMLHRHAERYRAIILPNRSVDSDTHDENDAIAEAVLGRKSLRAAYLIRRHAQRTANCIREGLQTYWQHKDAAVSN
ncbi:MAG: transcriptional regulator [Sphingomonas sp.]|nr:MAG: transcriptional regulator [Sphingomonas sp.]